MTPEQEIYLANRAKEVIENEAYQAAFTEIKEWIDIKWRETPTRDTAGREHLWLMQHLLMKLQASLEQTMASGALQAKELQHRRTMAERAKLWLA